MPDAILHELELQSRMAKNNSEQEEAHRWADDILVAVLNHVKQQLSAEDSDQVSRIIKNWKHTPKWYA